MIRRRSYYINDATALCIIVEAWTGPDDKPRALVIGGWHVQGHDDDWSEHFRFELPAKSEDDPFPGKFGDATLQPMDARQFSWMFERPGQNYMKTEIWSNTGSEPIAALAIAIDTQGWNEATLCGPVNELGVHVQFLSGSWTQTIHTPPTVKQ